VPGRGGGHRHGPAVGAGQLDRLPGGEATGGAAETAGAAAGGEDERDVGQEGASGVVQVVRVLVVREQHGVDRTEVGWVDRRGGGLGQNHAAGGVVPGGVEGRVGQDPQAAVLEEGGRAAEDVDGDVLGGGNGVGHGFTSRGLE
jgi:hypothetical protein